jgi:Holliday junction resolvase RusA-like endonuclease
MTKESDFFHVLWTGKAVSVNRWKEPHIISGGKPGMHETKAYREFKSDVAMTIKATGHTLIVGYYDMVLSVVLWKMIDTANIIKPVQDAIELSGIIKDDRYIRDVTVRRMYHKKSEMDSIQIELYRVSDMDATLPEDAYK